MKFLILAIALFTLPAQAASKFDFACGTHPLTTSFSLTAEGDQAVIRVAHHNGVKYMPIHEGIIVPGDLPYIENKAKVFQQMDEYTKFSFPLKNCKVYEKGVLRCHGKDTQIFNGVTFTANFINTKKTTTRLFDVSIDTIEVSMSFRTPEIQTSIDIDMVYSPTDCIFAE